MANSSTKLRALFVLASVLLLALVVNGKQLAGYATGTDEPLPPGCEDGAYVADGNVDANARRAAGSIVPAGECPAHCWCLGINCPDGILNAPECQNCAGGGGGGEDCNPDEDPTCILPGGGGKGGGGGGGGSPPFHDCYGFNPEIQCTGGEQGDDGKICICGQWVEDGGNEHALYFICTGLGDALIPLPSIPSSCELICDQVPNDFIDENFPFGLPSELQGLTPRQICLDICNDMCNGNPGCWEGVDLIDDHCCEVAVESILPASDCYDQEQRPLGTSGPSSVCCSENQEQGWYQQCLACCNEHGHGEPGDFCERGCWTSKEDLCD